MSRRESAVKNLAVLLPESAMDPRQSHSPNDCAKRSRKPSSRLGGEAQHITISIGIAALTPERDTRPTLMAAADTALYRAKNEGRNRVCVEP